MNAAAAAAAAAAAEHCLLGRRQSAGLEPRMLKTGSEGYQGLDAGPEDCGDQTMLNIPSPAILTPPAVAGCCCCLYINCRYSMPGKRNMLVLHCSLQRASGRMLAHTIEAGNERNSNVSEGAARDTFG
jgi:hypothetical protein